MRADGRRERIERIKRFIRFFRFVRERLIVPVCFVLALFFIAALSYNFYGTIKDRQGYKKQQESMLLAQKQADAGRPSPAQRNRARAARKPSSFGDEDDSRTVISPPQILPEYKELSNLNPDVVGWLAIDGTRIDYPVVQTPEDEEKYLYLDVNGRRDKRGTLIMDTDSTVGDGTLDEDYKNGSAPSTNLIIHGHTMKSGEMFGNLRLYADKDYGSEHNVIKFDTLYEHREYELIAVFYSQVFYEKDEVFKYYDFFNAKTQEEFDDWYNNIKLMSVYDTGVTADLGDEFITLSCCAYHVENGRFVVVGRRIM